MARWLGIGLGHDGVRVALGQLCTRREHSRRDQIQSRAGNEAGNDPAGARFAHRVGRDNDVGKLFGGHAVIPKRLQQINRVGAGNRAAQGSGNVAFTRSRRQLFYGRLWNRASACALSSR